MGRMKWQLTPGGKLSWRRAGSGILGGLARGAEALRTSASTFPRRLLTLLYPALRSKRWKTRCRKAVSDKTYRSHSRS